MMDDLRQLSKPRQVETRPRHWRPWLQLCAAGFAVFWGFFFFGIIDLTVFLQGPGFRQLTLVETGWGLFFLMLVGVPLGAVAIAPVRFLRVALLQILLAAVGLAASAAVGRSRGHWGVAAGLALTAGVVYALGRDQPVKLRSREGRWSWAVSGVAFVALIPAATYWVTMARTGPMAPGSDITWGLSHWPVQGALAVVIVLLTVPVAAGIPGWRLPCVTSAISASWLGVDSLLYPGLPASLGRAWGALSIAWALALFATSEAVAWRQRRCQASSA